MDISRDLRRAGPASSITPDNNASLKREVVVHMANSTWALVCSDYSAPLSLPDPHRSTENIKSMYKTQFGAKSPDYILSKCIHTRVVCSMGKSKAQLRHTNHKIISSSFRYDPRRHERDASSRYKNHRGTDSSVSHPRTLENGLGFQAFEGLLR